MSNTGSTDLSTYNNSWYKPGAGFFTRASWYVINAVYFKSAFPFNSAKLFFLRLFGAKLGRGVVLKPGVNIKYPWNLEVGKHCWIGENVWIDNLAKIKIGNNVCLSQGSMLITGNHDYSNTSFGLLVKEIVLEDGVWIGAKAVVCPGVTCKSHAVVSVGSVVTADLDAYAVYRGNPAAKVKDRTIS